MEFQAMDIAQPSNSSARCLIQTNQKQLAQASISWYRCYILLALVLLALNYSLMQYFTNILLQKDFRFRKIAPSGHSHID